MFSLKRIVSVVAMAVGLMAVQPEAAKAGIITNTLLTDVSGSGALAWAHTEVGDRIAYTAAIAKCELPGPCSAVAEAHASYIYDVHVSAGAGFYSATGLTPGSFFIPVKLDVFLLKTGNAWAEVKAFGYTQALGGCCNSTQYSATWGPLLVEDGASFQVQLTSWAISHASSGGGIGPVTAVGWADPIVSIDSAWQYAANIGDITIDEQLTALDITSDGTRPDGVDLGEAEPPSVPLPPGILLMAGALGLAGWRSRRRS